MREELRNIRVVPFSPWMPDGELVAFFGKKNVIEIRRGGGVCEVEVYSDASVEDLAALLREREDNYELEMLRRGDTSAGRFYVKLEKQLSKNAECEPITRVEKGVTEHGFRYLHDDGSWQRIWIQA
jgi:hypothetical protein